MKDTQLKNTSVAVDELFSAGMLPVWYGQQTKAMTEYVREHANLDEEVDAPLPEWAVRVLSRCCELGPKYRIRLALLHNQRITGVKIESGIMSDSQKKVEAASMMIKSGKLKLREVPKPAFFKTRKDEKAEESKEKDADGSESQKQDNGEWSNI